MNNIFRIALFSVSLIFVIFFSAAAETMPETNKSVGDFNSVFWWLEYAVRQADAVTDPDVKDSVYGLLGRAQAKAGDIDGANRSASAISNMQKRVHIHIAAAKTSYKTGNIPGYKLSMAQAKSAALSKRSIESAIFVNSNMIIAYLDCNDVEGAKSYAETLRNNPEAPKGYHDVELAYRKIASYFAWNNNIKDADLILKNKIKASGKDIALVEIAETCTRKGNMKVAEQIAERIGLLKYKDRVYEKLGAAFAERGNIGKAWAVVKMISDPVHKSFVIAAIAKYQVNSGEIDLGRKTAMDITYRDHKIDLYKLVVEKLAEGGEIDSAVKTIEMTAKMIEDSPMDPDKSKFGTFDDSFKKGLAQTMYLCVAKASAEKGDTESYNKYIKKAIDGVKEITDIPIWKSSVFIKIVEAQLQAGDIDGAKKTVGYINEEHSRSWGLFNIAKTQLDKGDIEGAITTAKDITEIMHKSFAYGEIASAFVKKGEFGDAKKVLLSLGSSSWETQAYRRTVMTFIETGHARELARWLDDIPTAQARVFACVGAVDGIMKPVKSKP